MNDNSSFLVLFLAPVKEYLADDRVSEILINGPGQIYIERNGKLEETPARFASEAQLKAAAVNIAKSVDRQLDEQHPDLDARLPDGSRKIVEIAEVLPLENGEYRLRSLLRWETRSVSPDGTVSGEFVLGEEPTFRRDAELLHLELPDYR